MNPYRETEPIGNTIKHDIVCIAEGLYMRRSWIRNILPDGTVVRKDGFTEQGDLNVLSEEGLL
jgi:hypothetical protein